MLNSKKEVVDWSPSMKCSADVYNLATKFQDFGLNIDTSLDGLDDLKKELSSFIQEHYLFEYKAFRGESENWSRLNLVVNTKTEQDIVVDLMLLFSMEELLYQIEHFKLDDSYGIEGVAVRSVVLGTFFASVKEAFSENIDESLSMFISLFPETLFRYYSKNYPVIKGSTDAIYKCDGYYRINCDVSECSVVNEENELTKAFWHIVKACFYETIEMKNNELLMSEGLLGIYSMQFKIDK